MFCFDGIICVGLEESMQNLEQRESVESSWVAKELFHNKSLWVGVGRDGIIYYSPDGRGWKKSRPSHLAVRATFREVSYGNGRFIAIGDRISVSMDGVSWNTHVHLTCNLLNSLAYGNDQWICVGENGLKMSSVDGGATWSDGVAMFGGDYRAVAFGEGVFVAVGDTLSGEGFVNTTRDGEEWSGERVGGSPLWDVAFGDGRFVAVDLDGYAHISVDGETWRQCVIKLGSRLTSVEYVNGTFLATSGRGRYHWSIDGVEWFEEEAFLPTSVTYGGGEYLGLYLDGRVCSARVIDGWEQAWGSMRRFECFAYGQPLRVDTSDSCVAY